jgi:hypothetical protein
MQPKGARLRRRPLQELQKARRLMVQWRVPQFSVCHDCSKNRKLEHQCR